MAKRIAVLGDVTTTGGQVVSASGKGFCGGQGIALLGDYVSCPTCKSMGKIIQAANNFVVDGKPAAYDGCIVACSCSPVGRNKIIATKSWIFVDVADDVAGSTQKQVQTSFIPNQEDKSRIRIDAQKLLDCAREVCEKHLYHADIKQAFITNVESVATEIVEQVDSGAMSYEDGSQKIKKEETSLWEQSLTWITNGLAIFGGAGMIMAGFALCSTGMGCLIGAPLMGHGLNGVYEGSAGIFNGVMNQIDGGNRSLDVDGPLRQAYQASAQTLGFDASVGNLAYDLIDFGSSVKGKLKLVPKLNEFGNPKFKLFYYGRKDLETAYRQMSRRLLTAEIIGDSLSLVTIIDDTNNAFILDKDTQQVSMMVSEPETITNVEQIVDNCSLVVTIKGDNEDVRGYFLCTRSDGTKYRKDYAGNITEGGIGQ